MAVVSRLLVDAELVVLEEVAVLGRFSRISTAAVLVLLFGIVSSYPTSDVKYVVYSLFKTLTV